MGTIFQKLNKIFMKEKKQETFEVKVTKWVGDALTSIKKKFKTFKEAKDYVEYEDGQIKIYNEKGELIESKRKENHGQGNNGHHGNHNQGNNGHHGNHNGHEDDDDHYH